MKFNKNYCIAIVLTLISLLLFASCDSKKKYNYYADKDNYISVVGTVSYIKQSEDAAILYLEFDNMSVQLSDNFFKVVGDNYIILQECMMSSGIHLGDQLEFVTAPRYFGDGYVMPIVSICREETVLLELQDGVENLLRWLDSQ